jgi:nucleoside-diphosphate-sugar epimerase
MSEPTLSAQRDHDQPRVLILGCGYTGAAVARQARARGLPVLGSARSAERARELEAAGIPSFVATALDASLAERVTPSTHVVIAFPPDGVTDSLIAPALAQAAAITYVSSTGVYGDLHGAIDDSSPLPDPPNARSARLLAGENAYRPYGATVLRSPAIYGPERGLHRRILRGDHTIPGDGAQILSRIHVEDLAALILASRAVRAETFVVGDLAPTPHIEVVRFVCATYGVPLPPCAPLHDLPDSLRANRAIDPSRALAALAVTLRYPSFREGMAPSNPPELLAHEA